VTTFETVVHLLLVLHVVKVRCGRNSRLFKSY
jgi:hypothetical protein